MNDRKTVIHFFTIADYEEEEVWLHNQHKNGWKLSRMIPPCLYVFEKCMPEDVAYKWIIKTMQKPATIFRFSGIMAGNIPAGVPDGYISVSLPRKRTASRMVKFSLIMNQGSN